MTEQDAKLGENDIISDEDFESMLNALGSEENEENISELLKAMNENRIITWEEAETIINDSENKVIRCGLPPQVRPNDPDNATDVDACISKLLANDSSLTEINLNNMKRTPIPQLQRLISAVKDNTALKKLSLANVALSNAAAEPILEVLETNSTLKSLNLETNFLSGDFLAKLFHAALKLQTLEEVKIVNQSPTFSTEAEMDIMKAIFENKGLLKVSIDLRHPEARSKVSQAMLRNCELLQSLPLRNIRITGMAGVAQPTSTLVPKLKLRSETGWIKENSKNTKISPTSSNPWTEMIKSKSTHIYSSDGQIYKHGNVVTCASIEQYSRQKKHSTKQCDADSENSKMPMQADKKEKNQISDSSSSSSMRQCKTKVLNELAEVFAKRRIPESCTVVENTPTETPISNQSNKTKSEQTFNSTEPTKQTKNMQSKVCSEMESVFAKRRAMTDANNEVNKEMTSPAKNVLPSELHHGEEKLQTPKELYEIYQSKWKEAEEFEDPEVVKCGLPDVKRPSEPENDTDIGQCIVDLQNNKESVVEINVNNMKRTPVSQIQSLIKSIPYSQHLKKLSLANLALNDHDLEPLLEVLRQNTSLEVLNLETNYLSGEFLTRLFQALLEKQTLTVVKAVNQSPTISNAAEKEITKAIWQNRALIKVSLNLRTAEYRQEKWNQ
ncbi:leucine Rich repeat-containing domain protein [Trichinella nativa]|uniref:Leucine Rich repeat-containing domain protein n=1 Tax=Trichinella nativa TaxID=6335 RepID=A0A1Y3EDD4_9BILA|nr:leucine Rich repeat-containing domain protein [Trichinella nativa]